MCGCQCPAFAGQGKPLTSGIERSHWTKLQHRNTTNASLASIFCNYDCQSQTTMESHKSHTFCTKLSFGEFQNLPAQSVFWKIQVSIFHLHQFLICQLDCALLEEHPQRRKSSALTETSGNDAPLIIGCEKLMGWILLGLVKVSIFAQPQNSVIGLGKLPSLKPRRHITSNQWFSTFLAPELRVQF